MGLRAHVANRLAAQNMSKVDFKSALMETNIPTCMNDYVEKYNPVECGHRHREAANWFLHESKTQLRQKPNLAIVEGRFDLWMAAAGAPQKISTNYPFGSAGLWTT